MRKFTFFIFVLSIVSFYSCSPSQPAYKVHKLPSGKEIKILGMDKIVVYVVFAVIADMRTEVAQFQIIPNQPTKVIFVETESEGGYFFKKRWLNDKMSEQAIIDGPCDEGVDPRMHCTRLIHHYEAEYTDSLISQIHSLSDPVLNYHVNEIKYEDSRFYKDRKQ